MRIRQYAYFAVRSTRMSADEMTARVGIQPDEVMVRGSRRASPPVPVRHSWSLVCREPGWCVDDQVAVLIQRLQPISDRLAVLGAELTGDDSHGDVSLTVVRYLDDADGEPEQLSPPDSPLQKLAGQHQLLGWTLDPDVIAFLAATGAGIDVDEYG